MENNSSPLDSVFQALSDATRRAVVRRLAEGPASVTDLARPFDMGLPAFLKHIGVLEAAGLLTTQKSGRVRTCALDQPSFAAAERWFEDQRRLWESRYANLDTLLSTLKDQTNDR